MTSIQKSPLILDELHRRIAEAQTELRIAPYAGLTRLECRQEGGCVVLAGSVPSFYLKQVAQSLLLRLLGAAISVDNRLEVKYVISTDLEIVREERVPCRL